MAKEMSIPNTAYVNAASASSNAGNLSLMHFTLRENRTMMILIAVWGLLTVLATVTGPFGTHDHLTFLPRFAYWACVVAVSLLGNQLVSTLSKKRSAITTLLIWAAFIVCTSGAVHLLNTLAFDAWGGLAAYAYLLGVVTVIVMVVHGVLMLINMVRPDQRADTPSDPTAQFLTRIPLGQRGALIRIEAQDHYLNVVTANGSSLILLRLGEAVKELGPASGLQVHRSHWVALDAVKSHRRTDGRDLLMMADGDLVPVSRSFRKAAQEAGLF